PIADVPAEDSFTMPVFAKEARCVGIPQQRLPPIIARGALARMIAPCAVRLLSGVAPVAFFGDLRAAPPWRPSIVRPLDCRASSHASGSAKIRRRPRHRP